MSDLPTICFLRKHWLFLLELSHEPSEVLIKFLRLQDEIVLWVKDIGESWPVYVILKALETPKPWISFFLESEPSINLGMVAFNLAG